MRITRQNMRKRKVFGKSQLMMKLQKLNDRIKRVLMELILIFSKNFPNSLSFTFSKIFRKPFESRMLSNFCVTKNLEKSKRLHKSGPKLF